jgi:uncharacterized protein (TIGR00730 family)
MADRKIKSINALAVFCGSSMGNKPEYADKAASIGKLFAEKKITLVYGAGNIGLMGVLADSILANGGKAIGVITERLVNVELAHKGLTELHVVETMSERKNLMNEMADGFVVLPGGMGTLDELFEILTLCQLSIIKKPVGLLNIQGFFNPLINLVEHSINERFIRAEHRDLFVIEEDEVQLIQKLENFKHVETLKWLENFKTEKF